MEWWRVNEVMGVGVEWKIFHEALQEKCVACRSWEVKKGSERWDDEAKLLVKEN